MKEGQLVKENPAARLEAKLNAKYDAVLVHSYWLSRENPHGSVWSYLYKDLLDDESLAASSDDNFRGSLRTRLATRAVTLLGENAGKIVFLGGHLKGPSYPSTAQLSRDEVVGNYGVPSDRIIALPEGYGTEEEAVVFKRLAQENGWKNVAVIGFNTHYRSIKRFLPEGSYDEMNVSHLLVEDIIYAKDEEKVKHLVKTLTGIPLEHLKHPLHLIKHLPRYELGFKGYEFVKDMAMKVPGAQERMYEANKKARTLGDDNIFNDLITHQIDVFNS